MNLRSRSLLAGGAFAAEPTFGKKTKPPKTSPVSSETPSATSDAALAELNTYMAKVAETRTLSYQRKIESIVNDAKVYLETYLLTNQAENSAVVMDLDETLFDNSANLLLRKLPQYPGYPAYVAFMQSSEAPAIPATRAFVDWVREKGFKLYFVSARKETVRLATALNLQKLGLDASTYEDLILKPLDFNGDSASDFKVGAQRDIEQKGHKVVMLLGDQASDGRGCLGRFFKLPNDLYEVP